MERAEQADLFEELGEYYLLNGGSHLKPPARIGAPALTWHTALWIPPINGNASFEVHREKWLESIDWFLASFARKTYEAWQNDKPSDEAEATRLRPHAFTEAATSTDASSQVALFRHRVKLWFDEATEFVRFDRLEDNEIDQYRNEVVSFKFFFHGIPMKLRASLHNEFVALTFIAELNFQHSSWQDAPIPSALRSCFKSIAETLEPRVEVLSVGSPNMQHLSDNESAENSRIKDLLAPSSSYLYNTFWDNVWNAYRSCLRPTFAMHVYHKGASEKPHSVRPVDGCTSLAPFIGRTFGDFRGVVLAGEMTKNCCALKWNIDQPFPERAKAESGTPLHILTDCEALALTDALVPLLEAAEPQAVEAAPAEQSQATVGSLTVKDAETSTRVAHGQAGSFRMGHEHTAARFLDGRVLYLSSLAAHQRWQVLEGVHEPLRFLLVVPRKNRWQLGRLIERLHLLGTLRLASLKDLIALNLAGEELRTFGLTLDKVEKGDVAGPPDLNAKLSKINAYCNDGILYRVERARYYTATFKELTKRLRIKRLEGYQPYDEFVYRRLGSTWDSIDRLGNRMERARRRVDSINEGLQFREQQMQTREQTKLLGFAEVAAVVPIAYYGGEILESIIPAFLKSGNVSTQVEGGHAYLGATSGIVGIAYFCLFLPLLRAHRRHRDASGGVSKRNIFWSYSAFHDARDLSSEATASKAFEKANSLWCYSAFYDAPRHDASCPATGTCERT